MNMCALDPPGPRGPAAFFARHPFLYWIALLAAGGGCVLFAARAARARGRARAGWLALTASQLAQIYGMLRLAARLRGGF